MHRAPLQISTERTELVEALLDAAAFDHPVADIELIETHISWLILAGDYVYKIKKPIVLDFLDFGSLERRHHFCAEEIRLNKPWAPDIYIDVVPVTMIDGRPVFAAGGEPVEYAVRMRRFAEDRRLDRQLEDGKLTVADMTELGRIVAKRHLSAPHIEERHRERVLRLTRELMVDNFSALDGYVDPEMLADLSAWTRTELDRRESLIAERFDGGFVRDCHGDLHLGNLVRLPDGIATFDCIEFNMDLRHIDVMCDAAFLVMDLVARQRHDLAAHFINRYLEATGDYDGVVLLSLFFVYRCLVRAKVAVIRSQERDLPGDARIDLDEAASYCEMALRQIRQRQPILVVMHGLSGSGKTWVAGQLMAALPAIRIRSDTERKRLFGLDEATSSDSPVGGGIYTDDANTRVYRRLIECAKPVLAAGHHVILDAAFLDKDSRANARRAAAEVGASPVIVDVSAPESTLRRRLTERARARRDPSEADEAVLDAQLGGDGRLSADETDISVGCDNSVSIDVDTLAKNVRGIAQSTRK